MSELRTSYLVGRADRVLRARLEESLAAAGVTLNELTVLSVLAARPGLSNARLARRSLVTPQAMHKVVRSLEDRGLVRRSSAAAGGRSLEAVITDAGRQLLADLEPLLTAVESAYLAPLDASERVAFESMLRRVSRLDSGGQEIDPG
jgi:DNA-binding MarR family transcriptional regulator